jgi:acetyl esterase/lipase
MHVLRFFQKRFPVQDPEAFVRFRRRAESIVGRVMHPPGGVLVERAIVGNIDGEWLVPQNAPVDPVILFLHGGGILFGWGSPNRRILGYLAKFTNLRSFGVDYRLAPEYVYPAAHEDCFAVYRRLTELERQIILVGESSGGVLALATLLRARAAGLPQPLMCVLISPLVDFGFTDSRILQYDDAFVDPKFIVEMHKHYVGESDTFQPDLGPIHDDLSGLAPFFILAGERELLRGEAKRLLKAASNSGIEAECVFWPNVWHGWHLFVPQLPEATNALKMLGGVIRKRAT